jgi:16S rRNA A1518/A1519 N6-dimethyltransferase RsmA/KsgA/DIM1 with predicted DNA glycosylase/AP lyase activity
MNNLKAAAPALRYLQPAETALKAAGIAPRRRAETLSVEEFAALYEALNC